MSIRIPNPLIPAQHTGAKSDSSAEKIFNDEAAAKLFYREACARLLHVNDWKKYAGSFTADFQLCDSKGKEADRALQLYDHFRIDVPGPGSLTGDGYDWVQVEALDDQESTEEDFLLVTVRPVTNPNNDKEDIAHFLTEEASSTFMIRRLQNRVIAEIHGRNEKPNTEADKITDKARNALAGTLAISGFSKLEWQSLADGLINFTKTD